MGCTLGIQSDIEEEHTPQLFENNSQHQNDNELNEVNASNSEKFFDQDPNEDEDFEIPAFLRKQKF